MRASERRLVHIPFYEINDMSLWVPLQAAPDMIGEVPCTFMVSK